MTRIALIAGTYQPDRCGVAHYTAHLREKLAEQGIETVVLTTHDAANQLNDRAVHSAVCDWSWTNLRSLVWAVHTSQADLLHIQHAAGTYRFERAIFLLPLLLRWSGWRKPIVTTIHEYGWWEWQPKWFPSFLLEKLKTWGQQRGWWDREDGFLLTHSNAIITTNSDAERVIRERLPEVNDRLHRIPIAANVEVAEIDPNIARHELRQRCNWSDDAIVIAFFGFLHPVKGLETLLPAFKQVVAAHPQARLLLVGGVESLALPGEQADRYWQKLHALVAELGLQDRVHLTGYLSAEAASRRLSGADIGVLPFNHGVNLKSGSLLALLAHGLPTIATYSHPPDPDLAGSSGVQLVPPRQIHELAAALNQLLISADTQSQLRETGYSFVQKFDWHAIVQAHLSIYQTSLNYDSAPADAAVFSEDTSSLSG
jgi:polysaccharide biosynthesis protein PslF